ncbi:MAG: response regulator, partial [Sphingobium sp.]
MMLGHVAGAVQEAEVGAPITGYEGERRSILVVDDDADQLRLMRGLLESLGFDVAVAANGEAGLALSESGRFDVAVLDISMPGLSGWDTAQRLRERHGTAMRIAMLSGNAHERHGPETGEAVHDRFIVKPVELAGFIDAIGSMLGLRWTHATDNGVTGQPAAANDGEAMATTPLPAAALPHVERLYDLLRIGHVRGIEGEIKLLAATGPDPEMIARLYGCLDRFDLPALRATLDHYQ